MTQRRVTAADQAYAIALLAWRASDKTTPAPRNPRAPQGHGPLGLATAYRMVGEHRASGRAVRIAGSR